MSSHINKHGYIASFNIPFFPDIFNISGYRAHGYNYTTDPRSQIFQRNQSQVDSIASLSSFMNSNDYKNDLLSQGSPCNQISARCDLPNADGSEHGYAFGGIDSKNVDRAHVYSQQTWTIGGQTHDQQPPFAWGTKYSSVAHAGMPAVFNFTWREVAPQLPSQTRAFPGYQGADVSYLPAQVRKLPTSSIAEQFDLRLRIAGEAARPTVPTHQLPRRMHWPSCHGVA